MKQNASILNNNYNNVTYCNERTMQNSTIEIDPGLNIYEESTTEDISNLYSMTKLYEILYEEFQKSPFYNKYGKLLLKKRFQSEYSDIKNNFIVEEEYKEPIDDYQQEEEIEEIDNQEEIEENTNTEGILEDANGIYGIDDSYLSNPEIMEKYDFKKIEKKDYSNLYYYFKNILVERDGYNEMEVFCAIAEFFKINYDVLYNDIISIESKTKILDILKDNHKLSKDFSKVNRLY